MIHIASLTLSEKIITHVRMLSAAAVTGVVMAKLWAQLFKAKNVVS